MHTQRNNSERPRSPRDFYRTPYALAHATIKHLHYVGFLPNTPDVLDPGCGDGVWGKAVRRLLPEAFTVGVDIKFNAHASNTYNYFYGDTDYVATSPKPKHSWEERAYHLIVGNPPYKDAQAFVERSLGLLRPGGIVAFLLRLEFLAGHKRQVTLFDKGVLDKVYVLTRRPSFFQTKSGSMTTDAMDYGIFVFSNNPGPYKPMLDWLYWTYDVAEYENE